MRIICAYGCRNQSRDFHLFINPAEEVKNGEEPLVALNPVAKSVIDNLRGLQRYLQRLRQAQDIDQRSIEPVSEAAFYSHFIRLNH